MKGVSISTRARQLVARRLAASARAAATPGRCHSNSAAADVAPPARASAGPSAPNGSTVDEAEVRKFSALAGSWWRDDGHGPFAALHSLNALRVPLIRRALLEDRPGNMDEQRKALMTGSGLPLDGFRVLDVGCGGGILSEGLGRQGAAVTGIDASDANVAAASLHVRHDPALASRVSFRSVFVEDLAAEVAAQLAAAVKPTISVTAEVAVGGDAPSAPQVAHAAPPPQLPRSIDPRYDAVVASEVLEHVGDVPRFLTACADLVRPGGVLVATTLNRTAASLFTAILGAEYVLRLVPPGTHEWAKFIPPEDLAAQLRARGLTVVAETGMRYNPLTARWSWAPGDLSVNYALVAAKPRGV